MPRSIDLRQLKELLDEGAQLVEALPAAEYAQEHLPRAINIPLTTLSCQRTAA